MASLQKIRNHGTLLIVIVGVAMLAFILGDFLSNSNSIMHRDAHNIGSIAGHKISKQEFAQTRDLLERIQKDADKFMIPQSDSTQISYAEYLMQRGVYIPQEINNEVVWEYYKQYYTYLDQAEEMGLAISPEEEEMLAQNLPFISADNMVENPNFPLYLPEIVVKGTYLQQKYIALMRNMLSVNSLEAEFAFNSRQQGISANYVQIPFEAIADSLVEVSENDIKKLYNQYKSQLKQDPYRVIEYVVINYKPTDADRAADSLEMMNIATDFRTAQDVEAMLEQHNSDEGFTTINDYTAETIPAQLMEFAFGAQAEVDNSTDVIYDGEANMMARIIAINKAQKTVSLAILKHTIVPSDVTKTNTKFELKNLVANNRDIESFEQAVSKAGYMPQTITVRETTQQIGKLEGSRNIIQEAFDTKEGNAINDAFEYVDKVVIAAVVEASDDRYTPMDKVYGDLKILATNNAKADYIAALHPSIANLEEISQAYGQPIQTIARVALSDVYPDAAMVGAALAQGENALSGPVKGEYGVYFVQTGSAMNTNEVFDDAAKEAEKAQLSNAAGSKFQRAIQLLSSELNTNLYSIQEF